MDKIWYENPSRSEVISRCGGDEQNRMTTQSRQKSTAKKKIYIDNTWRKALILKSPCGRQSENHTS